MKIASFVFRYRAALISCTYSLGFSAYAIDHVNASQAIIRWLLDPDSPNGLLATRLLLGVGALLVAFGAFVRTWGAAYLRSSVVHDAKSHSSTLVADGPYRHVRHPLYFASIISTIGTALLASRLGFVIMVVILTLLYVQLAGWEEAQMKEQQGEGYREYCERVPRLWPSIPPRVPESGAVPHWRQAFWGEAFMWGFAIAIGAFAITLKQTVLWSLMGTALLLFLEQQIVHNLKRRKREAAAQAV
jgi:protein-S-isoprenylcysteine O-methyltransferase Ste14